MQVEFITTLNETEYNKIIEKEDFIHYKADNLWNKLNNVENIIFVGLKNKNKFLASAKIELISKEKSIYFNVSNISILKNDDIIKNLFVNELIRLAKKYNAYKIKIIDINTEKKLKYKKKSVEKYSLIKLCSKNKFYRKDFFKKIFKPDDTKLLLVQSKLNYKDLNELNNVIKNWNIKLNFDIKKLIDIYKSKCLIIVEKIDLVFYLNKIQTNISSQISTETIEELIDEYGEEMIVGFSICLFPNNKNTAYCISINCIDSFKELQIKDNLILETISSISKKKYKNAVFLDDINNSSDIFEYRYEIVLNKFKHFISKLKKDD